MYQDILYDVDAPLATVTLNRPDRLNAWTDRMGLELRHAVAQAEADENVVAIIVTGAGRGFCAGADLQGLSAISAGERSRTEVADLDAEPGDAGMNAGFRAAYTFLMSVRKPIIAAINGPCAGMALPIALSCDLRFASDRAVFTVAFPHRGLVAEWGISWLLPRVVGTGHALDLILSGRKVDAAEAERIGLVNRTVPHDELLPTVRDYVMDLAENVSPASMQVMKRQVWTSLQRELGDAMDEAIHEMRKSFDRPDFKEGVESYVQKRSPKFPRV